MVMKSSWWKIAISLILAPVESIIARTQELWRCLPRRTGNGVNVTIDKVTGAIVCGREERLTHSVQYGVDYSIPVQPMSPFLVREAEQGSGEIRWTSTLRQRGAWLLLCDYVSHKQLQRSSIRQGKLKKTADMWRYRKYVPWWLQLTQCNSVLTKFSSKRWQDDLNQSPSLARKWQAEPVELECPNQALNHT